MQITTELFIAEKKIMGCAVLCTPHSVFSVQIISELPVEFILFSVFGNIDRIISGKARIAEAYVRLFGNFMGRFDRKVTEGIYVDSISDFFGRSVTAGDQVVAAVYIGAEVAGMCKGRR